jgi:hypothetical protein
VRSARLAHEPEAVAEPSSARVLRFARVACLAIAVCALMLANAPCARAADSLESPESSEAASGSATLEAIEVSSDEATNLTIDEDHLELLSGSDLETSVDWSFRSSAVGWWQRVKSDHCHFYSGDSLRRLAIGTAVAGVMANTNIDRSINDSYQTNLASHSDWYDVFHSPKPLGNGIYTLPAFGIAWAAGSLFDDTRSGALIGEWGERSLRSFVVGAPPLVMMQQLTGGSRPGETTHHSQWRPFQDDNGASGHSFMGALPFLSAAKMTDEPWLKAAFYVGSTATGISRVNDGDHYASQAVLGWWIAYLAADAVDRTQADSSVWTLTTYPDPYTTGVALAIEY